VLTLTLILCAVAALLGGLVLRALVTRHEPVRSARLGMFSVELRRRALVREHPSGMGGEAFRQPSESRIRVFRVAGFPVWQQGRSVDLPMQVMGMIGTLTARDFDAEFDDRFRLASFATLAPAWMARLFGRDGGGKGGTGRAAGRSARRIPH
jgi:hypothetical protein